LKSQIFEIQSNNPELQAALEERKELKREIAQLNRQLDSSRLEIQLLQRENALLEEKARQNKAFDDLQRENLAYLSEIEELKAEVSRLKEDSAKSRIQSENHELTEKLAAFERVSDRVSDLESETADLRFEKEESVKRNSSLREENELLREQVETQRHEIQAFQLNQNDYFRPDCSAPEVGSKFEGAMNKPPDSPTGPLPETSIQAVGDVDSS
jgi:chromosome segregation ATPase